PTRLTASHNARPPSAAQTTTREAPTLRLPTKGASTLPTNAPTTTPNKTATILRMVYTSASDSHMERLPVLGPVQRDLVPVCDLGKPAVVSVPLLLERVGG